MSTREEQPQRRGAADERRVFPWAAFTAVLAVGAPTLYAIGAIKTLGRLHAAGLDGRELFPLIPLQEHLLNGLAVVLGAIPILGAFALLYIVVRISWQGGQVKSVQPQPQNREVRGPAPEGDEALPLPAWTEKLERRVWPAVAGLTLLFAAVVGPWWIGPLLILAAACVVAAYLADSRWFRGRLRRHPGLPYTLGLLTASLVGSALLGYIRADPPPRIAVQLQSGRVIRGTLVSKDAELIYVGSGGGNYIGLPIDKVVDISYQRVRRGEPPSLLELTGISKKRTH